MVAFTIGKVAEQSGVHIETIRYYEKIGLMPRPNRSPSGYRNYEPAHVKRLAFIRRSRELGFTLEEIRELLKLVGGHRFTCAQVQDITLRHIADIRQKITALRRMERVLSAMAAQCKGGQIPECPVIDALFKLDTRFSTRGSTARNFANQSVLTNRNKAPAR